MKNLVIKILIVCLVCAFSIHAQKKYEPTWESIDSRPVAPWFEDAKLGIFIHWGPYSVPAYSPAGTYTEWYQYWWYSHSIFGNNQPDKNAIPDFQSKVYGEASSYYDFARMFKAELYDPKQWADLFKRSGAKYVILTSKHHDGFTLWPNKHAQNARHFPWNAGEVGAKRDLIEPYMKAMREAGLKAGLYYSLYEWYHPWYAPLGKDNRLFVNKHYHPQFKELVERYQPDIIYADGEWERNDDYWKSAELIQWLFNESPCKDYVVINDRWFNGCRHKHGGYYTTEYLREPLELATAWEEIRGIGTSFGYNRDEDLEDYASAQQLVLMLCDIVSMGGNLCLNVGPSADGKIPVIQQQRLLEIGEWLTINGEAIYNSFKYETSWQWSEGDRHFKLRKEGDSYTTADYIIRQTLEQQPGKAVKELFFTQNKEAVFAISPKWPGGKLVIKEFTPKNGARISLLGVEAELDWKQVGENVEIELPAYDPQWNISDYAYSFKIEK
jgi:alpha-L-fucosidase